MRAENADGRIMWGGIIFNHGEERNRLNGVSMSNDEWRNAIRMSIMMMDLEACLPAESTECAPAMAPDDKDQAQSAPRSCSDDKKVPRTGQDK